ncbi:3-deoxy-manno-octulosonate cytidylyltransferase [Sphingopyxis panaciterrae]
MIALRRDVLIVIPARHAASRFPGKMLAPLRGADGISRPLIEHSWRAAAALGNIADVVIATDDATIADVAANFGAQCIMTSSDCRNGTERCAEIAGQVSSTVSLIVNLQGDSPAIAWQHVKALIDAWGAGAGEVLTPFIGCSPAMRAHLTAEITAGRPSGVFAVADRQGLALYFSRSPIPVDPGVSAGWKLHVGLYAYTPAALARYAQWDVGTLEAAEALEQLRFLENGEPVALVKVDPVDGGYGDVNYPSDIEKVEELLRRRRLP